MRAHCVMFVGRTGRETRLTRSLPEAIEWITDQVLREGHEDGFEVTLTLEVLEVELPDDTKWLERAWGMVE